MTTVIIIIIIMAAPAAPHLGAEQDQIESVPDGGGDGDGDGDVPHGDEEALIQQDEEAVGVQPGLGASSHRRQRQKGDLGIIRGVFCPVSISMFSTLLFLRPGFIVANLGVLGSFLALVLAYALLGLTVQSLSAIVTNGDVHGGGVYYMLSRCLGPEIGGTIGMVFYAANVVGSALYATGSAESLLSLGVPKDFLGSDRSVTYFLSSCCNVASLSICVLGAGMFGNFSCIVLVGVIGVFGAVALNFGFATDVYDGQFNVTTVPHCQVNCTYQAINGSFRSLYMLGTDGIEHNLKENFYSAAVYDCQDPAMYVSAKTAFAVLFSGVTGIMAGANLSGELKSPSKSIPKGTYFAMGFTFTIYTLLFVLTGATCDRDLLYHDCNYLSKLQSYDHYLVPCGALVSTFCAATSGLIGASQLIQAVAKDNILPKYVSSPLKWGVVRGRPVVAYFLSFLIVQGVLLIPSLNQIAKLCTVCYLLSYGFVNISIVLLDWSAAINFRPTMSTHWGVGLIAVCLCVAAMAAVSITYSLIGFFVTLIFLACVIFGTRHGEKKNWGSVQQGILYHQVRKYLLMLDTRKYHVKFWRPQILLLVRDPTVAENAIRLGNNLKKGGLYVLGHVFKGGINSLRDRETCPTLGAPQPWLDLVDRLGVKAFHNLTVASSLRGGVQQLVRLSGIGAMKPNIVMMGFKRGVQDRTQYAEEVVETVQETEARGHNEENENNEADGGGDNLANNDVQEEDSNLIPWNSEGFSVSCEEYCNMIRDMARFHKSVVLHRNVQDLEGEPWMRRNLFGCRVPKSGKTLDVWLVDFLSPPNAILDDFSSMLMLQLAFIASGKLGGLPIRAFLRCTGEPDSDHAVLNKFQE